MKPYALFVLFLALSLGSGFAGPPGAGTSASALGPPLHFNRTALGNVVRLLSAKYRATVSVAANARAPVTGDFSALTLRAALAEAARQAGLTVVALGSRDSDGFRLQPGDPSGGVKVAPSPQVPAQEDLARPAPRRERRAEPASGLPTEADRRREALLRRRRALLEEAGRLGQGGMLSPPLGP